MDLEIRGTKGLELRVSGGKTKLVGYAAVFGKKSTDFGGFVEMVEPGAFKRSLKTGDIRAFDSHDQSKIVGRESAGTLDLREDTKGLRVEITPPDTQVGRDLVENVRNGNLDGMSIGFLVVPDGVRWDFKVQPAVRHLLDADLREVSVVAIPAFPDTSVALRSMPKGPRVAELQEMLTAKTAAWQK